MSTSDSDSYQSFRWFDYPHNSFRSSSGNVLINLMNLTLFMYHLVVSNVSSLISMSSIRKEDMYSRIGTVTNIAFYH